MNHLLQRTCFAMWAFGFAGMWLTKGFEPYGDAAFAVAARLSLVGGASVVFLLGLELFAKLRAR